MLDEDTYLTADGFDDAIIGVATPWQAGNKPVAIYDGVKCIEMLMDRLECCYSDAEEYFTFNVAGAYVGEQTPIFVFPPSDFSED